LRIENEKIRTLKHWDSGNWEQKKEEEEGVCIKKRICPPHRKKGPRQKVKRWRWITPGWMWGWL